MTPRNRLVVSIAALFLMSLSAASAQIEEAQKLRDQAQAYFEEENWAAAIDTFLKAFDESPGTSQEYRLVAAMMLWEDRADESVLLLKEAEKEHPDNLAIKVDLGVAYNATEQYDLAVETFERLEIRVGKTNPDLINDAFYFSYGAAAERLKDYELAETNFKKAIEMVPIQLPQRAAMPMNYLGYMWVEQNRNLDEAGILIVQANNLAPQSGAYADSLGWWHFKKKNYKAALSELLHAVDLMDGEEDPVVYDHLAQTYFAMDQTKKAIDYLQKAVKLDPENEEISQRLEEYSKDTKPTDAP